MNIIDLFFILVPSYDMNSLPAHLNESQKAAIRQVLSLTQQQIEVIPIAQRQQILAIRAQYGSS